MHFSVQLGYPPSTLLWVTMIKNLTVSRAHVSTPQKHCGKRRGLSHPPWPHVGDQSCWRETGECVANKLWQQITNYFQVSIQWKLLKIMKVLTPMLYIHWKIAIIINVGAALMVLKIAMVNSTFSMELRLLVLFWNCDKGVRSASMYLTFLI